MRKFLNFCNNLVSKVIRFFYDFVGGRPTGTQNFLLRLIVLKSNRAIDEIVCQQVYFYILRGVLPKLYAKSILYRDICYSDEVYVPLERSNIACASQRYVHYLGIRVPFKTLVMYMRRKGWRATIFSAQEIEQFDKQLKALGYTDIDENSIIFIPMSN